MNKLRKTQVGLFASIGIICLVSVLAIGVVAFAYYGEAPKIVNESGGIVNYNEAQLQPQEQLGAVSGPDVYQWMNFHAGYQSGGSSYATTSTATTYTLVAKDIPTGTTWLNWKPNINTTVTLMATTSVNIAALDIPDIGDTRTIYLYNASTTVASTITLAAGTGIDLQKNEDTGNLATAGTSVAELTFIRKPNKDVMVILDQWDVAD